MNTARPSCYRASSRDVSVLKEFLEEDNSQIIAIKNLIEKIKEKQKKLGDNK